MTTQRHRVLVLGVGSIGERHLRCFQATGRADVSLAEPNAPLRQAIAERYGVRRNYADLEAALADGPLDAAVVATPAPWHIPLAARLVEAGLPVLIEKPLSTSLDGIDELTAAARRRGLVAAVAYVYRRHPLLRAMRAAIAQRRFGPPVELVAVSGQHFPTYRPAYRETYYRDRATGGGAIQDALTHTLNVGQWLLGPVDRLVADAAHQVLDGVEVEDTVHLLARHGDVLASYSLNQHQAPNETVITVVCRQGTVRAELHEHRWRWMTTPGGQWHDEPIEPLQRDTLFAAQAHAFLDAVEGQAPPDCSIDEGLQTLRAALAALDSVRRGAWQSIGCGGPGDR